MKQAFVVFLYLIFISPLYAANINQSCNELWFARNAMLDRGGYCFSSPLGQSIFNNEDCSTQSPSIGKAAREMIEEIRKDERDLGCSVDTNVTDAGPFLRFMSERMQLDVQPPIPEDWQSQYSCIDYQGEPISVYSAPDRSSQVLATINVDGDISFSHQFMLRDGTFDVLRPVRTTNERVWQFITVFAEGEAIGKTGWILMSPTAFRTPLSQGGSCDVVTG
nr:YARHG domain-containing protein [Sulfitobacter algicola]